MPPEPANVDAESTASPYDAPLSSGLRFAVELVAWSAGPWAAAEISGRWWAALPVLLVLFAVPAVFSTSGDKNLVIVATPGPVRLMIELALCAIAAAGSWVVWPLWAAIVVTVLVTASLTAGLHRARWLLDRA